MTAPAAADLPVTTPERGRQVALAQRRALIVQLEQLAPGQWDAATECVPWRVRDIAAHIAGELVYARNPLAYVPLTASWLLRDRHRSFLDGTNEAALRARADWTPMQLLDALRRDAPRAVPPGWARWIPLPGVAGLPGDATFGYLADVVLPRDCWMHRQDIAGATGSVAAKDATDGEVVAQVVRDLGRHWRGPASVLKLTGTAGGSWRLGDAASTGSGEEVEVDAVEFLRHVSGRVVDPELFGGVADPLGAVLRSARVAF
ncbi:MAG: maleylpyruvate isomerase family mycothiol-dependent enzyme [Propionicimonas sp.]|uniref:maleylpyruvate isomerase family mycothiol-dependent enzyme n=1 Tax=Propionicimonas sp. TaxID=1955623 RepID=UPI003D13C88F